MAEFASSHAAQAPARPDAVLQRRGVERVNAILDAGESILAKQGYEAATLKAVSERAGIPIASIYHYFADRHQVDQAILQRHLATLDRLVKKALDDAPIASLADAVDAVADPMVTYFRREPSCVELWFAGRRDDSLTELVEAYDEETAEWVWQLAIDRGLLANDTPLLAVQLAFQAATRLFDSAFRHSRNGDDVTIDEARRMLVAYLGTYAP